MDPCNFWICRIFAYDSSSVLRYQAHSKQIHLPLHTQLTIARHWDCCLNTLQLTVNECKLLFTQQYKDVLSLFAPRPRLLFRFPIV